MLVYKSKYELQRELQTLKFQNKSVGFVPTMGALHEGHLSLVESSLNENDTTVVSIFVNPTQFDNNADLEHYPTDLAGDIALLKKSSEAIIIFAPDSSEIYDDEVQSREYDLNGLDQVMEGSFRKGHFEGVATIVQLLLEAVKPQRAYFGEKDFQQLQIIRLLVKQLGLNVEIRACPISRETNGLARSSRNERLSPLLRNRAGVIFQTLQTVKKKFGTVNAEELKDWVIKRFDDQEDFELEYFEIADVDTLTPLTEIKKNLKYRGFIAVYAESVRLIDNMALN